MKDLELECMDFPEEDKLYIEDCEGYVSFVMIRNSQQAISVNLTQEDVVKIRKWLKKFLKGVDNY
ncbi:hypothetical protein BC6_00038 [Bacillus phage BC-6]|nr:hypothetical protein BC6_00038 [Bacillus phage BC-6]